MSDENVYLYVPNLIGYARVVLALVAFYFMPSNPIIAATFYLLSQFLDAFDGHAARLLNQCTKFGAVLDMVTDRCSTAGLLMVLAQFYSNYQFVFQFIVVLDIASHWVQVYSNLLAGNLSHKKVAESGNFFLRLYYTSRVVLFTMCAGNELCFAMLYVMNFYTGPLVLGYSIWFIVFLVCLPICILKNGINIIQLVGGFQILNEIDMKEKEEKSS